MFPFGVLAQQQQVGGAALWTPAELNPDAWIDPSDVSTVTLDASDRVSQIDDKSGNGRHLTQDTEASRPNYDSVNGFLQGTGTQLMEATNAFNEVDGTLNAFSMFCVAKPNKVGNALGSQSATGTYYYTYAQYNNNIFGVGGNTGGVSGPVASRFSISTDYIALTDTRNGLAPYSVKRSHSVGANLGIFGLTRSHDGKRQSYINGAGVAGADMNVDNLSWAHYQYPSTYTANGTWDGDAGEMVLVRRILTADEREKLEGYFAHKWGLTASLAVGHPYKSAAPLASEGAFVTDGLIYHLDARTPECYPGSGTAVYNLAPGTVKNGTLGGSYVYNSALAGGVFEFDGGSTTLLKISGGYLDLRYTNHTITYVARCGSGAKGRVLGSYSTTNWLGGFHGGLSERYYANGDWVYSTGNSDLTDWQCYSMTADYSGDLWQLYKNGLPLHTANSNGVSGPYGLALGGDGVYPAENSDCDSGWLLVHDRVLSPQEISDLYNFIKERYGL